MQKHAQMHLHINCTFVSAAGILPDTQKLYSYVNWLVFDHKNITEEGLYSKLFQLKKKAFKETYIWKVLLNYIFFLKNYN